MSANLYTEARAEAILKRLSSGEPLAEICRSEGMPAVRTVSDWRKAHPAFDVAFLQARDDGFDALAADCLRIANTPLEGEETKLDADGNVVEVKRSDMLGHRKLQIETRFKLLAKWDPRRYGDKMTLSGDPEHPLSGLSDAEIDARLKALLAKQKPDDE